MNMRRELRVKARTQGLSQNGAHTRRKTRYSKVWTSVLWNMLATCASEICMSRRMTRPTTPLKFLTEVKHSVDLLLASWKVLWVQLRSL
jgi:hypothetical protein